MSSLSQQESLQKIGSNQAADDQINKGEENKASQAPVGYPKNGCTNQINDNQDSPAAIQRNKLLAASQ